MPRPRREPDTSSYAGRIAARLAELRESKDWSIEDVQDRLRKLGIEIGASTLYGYERGHDAGGSDLPINAIPFIARLYGFGSATAWLPKW